MTPYRAVFAPALCHPTATAWTSCADCAAPTCDGCLCFYGNVARCLGCALGARRRAGWRRLASLLAGVAAFAGVAVAVSAWRQQSQCVGPDELRALIDAKQPDAALARVEACPHLHQHHLLTVRYLAHRALGRFDDAADDTETALRASPHDDFVRIWHISALEEAGHVDEASRLLAELERDIDARPPPPPPYAVEAVVAVAPQPQPFEALTTRVALIFERRGRYCDGESALKGASAWFFQQPTPWLSHACGPSLRRRPYAVP